MRFIRLGRSHEIEIIGLPEDLHAAKSADLAGAALAAGSGLPDRQGFILGYAAIAVRSLVELCLANCARRSPALMEPVAGDGRTVAGELPIWLAIPAELDLPGAVWAGGHITNGLEHGAGGGTASGMGRRGHGGDRPAAGIGRPGANGQRAGIWLMRLPGCPPGILEHHLHCRLAALGSAVPDSPTKQAESVGTRIPEAGDLPGDDAPGGARSDCLVHALAGRSMGWILGMLSGRTIG